MLLNNLGDYMNTAGFTFISANIPELDIYYKVTDSEIAVIQVMECHESFFPKREQFISITNQIRNLFRNKGYSEIIIFSIICTNDTERAKLVCEGDDSHWIVDTQKDRMLIYENQPSDFYGVYSAIKRWVDNGRKPISMKVAVRQRLNSLYGHRKRAVVNTTLVLLNIIIFLFMDIFGSTTNVSYMESHGALLAPLVINGNEYYRLITSMFLHFGVNHLFNNMLVLFFLGDYLERVIGSVNYLLIYIMSGITGNLLSLWYAERSQFFYVSAGASGAIFGVIGALFFILLIHKGRIENLTVGRLGFLILCTFYYGFTSSGIDNMAHIGGLAGGMFFCLLIYRRKVIPKRKI